MKPSRRKASPGQQFLLPLNIKQLEDGRFLARSKALPGLNVVADTVGEVIALAPDVARALIEAMKSQGVAPPATLEQLEAPLRVQLVVAA